MIVEAALGWIKPLEPRLLNQTAVGKGLNVKGKSAKRNHLSGFVPFLQISDNKHKRKLGKGVMNARVRVYFQTHEAQELVKMELASIMRELESQHELEPIRPGRTPTIHSSRAAGGKQLKSFNSGCHQIVEKSLMI